MSHEDYRDWLVLSRHGELTVDQEAELERHLAGCEECARFRDELEQMESLLEAHPSRPGESLLRSARRDLRRTLEGGSDRWSWWPAFLSAPLAAAVAALVLGIAIGYFASPARPATDGQVKVDPLLQSDVQISNVRFRATDPATGQVELAFDAVKNVTLRGSLADAPIQQVLTHALTSGENPDVRLRAVKAMERYQLQKVDPEVKAALIDALKWDRNPGVRKRALEVLRRMPLDAEIRDAVLYALVNDKNSGIRVAAINCLQPLESERQLVDREVLDILEQTVREDENDYVRIRARGVLQEARVQ